MAEFEFTSPDGNTYVVTGPDGATHQQAFQILQQQIGAQKASFDPEDIAKSAGIGAVKGVIGAAGLPGDASSLAGAGASWLAGKVGLGEQGQGIAGNVAGRIASAVSPFGISPPTSETIQKGVESLTGPFYKPKTTAGEYAQTGGEFLPAMIGPGGIIRKGLGVASSALGSEYAGQQTKGTAAEPYMRVLGALVGPAALHGAGIIANPVVSNIAARVNPTSFAEKQFGRIVSDSGKLPEEIVKDVVQAGREGQSAYAVADAMGNAGQRGLSTVARSPGEGRTETVNFLDARQSNQGRRMANTLAKGFGAPETAAATEARMTAERTASADVNYEAARQTAGAVNVTPAIKLADAYLKPGSSWLLKPNTNIADNSIESAVHRAKSYLTDGKSQVSRFEDAFQAKQEIDNIIEGATKSQQRVLIPIRNALDNQLASASKPYAAARDQFRKQSVAIDAIDLGKRASQSGRFEDTIKQFKGLPSDEAKQAFRTGYIDPEIAKIQAAPFGVNKARPYSSDAFINESKVMAKQRQNPQMARRIGREETMFQTRNTALGGSKTFDNIADNVAMGLSPDVIAQAATGGVKGLVKQGYLVAANTMTGNTAAVRAEVGRMLRMNRMNSSPAKITEVLTRANHIVAQRINANRSIYLGGPALEAARESRESR